MTKIVYWARHCEEKDYAQRAMFLDEPTRLMPDLASIYNKDSSVFACPSVKNKHKNTFVIKFPVDVSITTYGGKDFITDAPYLIDQRPSMYKDGFAFDVLHANIFYCFEDQILETSPPYFHQTSYSALGHAPSGSFNIHNWFRPSVPNITTFPSIQTFKALEGDALVYLNFPSQETVILKQFMMTDRLIEIANGCLNLKHLIPNQSLESIYSRFRKAGLNKLIEKEIMNNLITPKL